MHASYVTLLNLMSDHGITVSQKLIAPSMQVTYLGVMIDTDKDTISNPPDEREQINITVHQWLDKSGISKCQLQYIFGQLLYVHKCVKPAHVF